MKPIKPATPLFAFIALTVGTGCVPVSEYTKLKNQFDRQEAYVSRHREDVKRAQRETTRVHMTLRNRELEIQKLKEKASRLNHELTRSKSELTKAEKALAAKPKPAPVPATVSKATIKQSKPQPAAAPAVAGFAINKETNGIVLDQAVMFGAGSSKLKPAGRRILQDLAARLNRAPYRTKKVRVEGHTDSQPIRRSKSFSDNWHLSGARARSVLKALAAAGISDSRLSFAGYAFHRPMVKGRGKSAMAKNRRVEIVLLD